ncbi:MAG: hypothetical protein HZA90_17390 [Verrucomicrobia bacterium]|nr:hypothetical protein [Verrucomicrobiota bacterium]
MSKSELYFVKGQALPFLLARARAVELPGPFGGVAKAAHLVAIGVLLGHKDNGRKYVNGEVPLTPAHAQHIREKLKMTDPEWDAQWAAITERRGWELTSEGIENLTEFFSRLRRRGLEEAVAFAPRRASDLDLAAFCVPARVITEEEWSSLFSVRGGLALDSSSEAEALLAKRACGVLFNGWLGRAHQRVVVQGEPGEGKTTAVWLYIDELCRRWEESLRRNTHRDSTVWIPLVLPLGAVQDNAKEGETLTNLALQHVLALVDLATGMADPVREWLGKKLAAGQYVLLLDALDELPAARLPWLRKELAGLRGTRVVLTSRYHADPRAVLAQYTLLRMVPLRWWIIDEFITRYFDSHPASPKLPNVLRRTLRQTPALRQLSRNPFLLGAMCHLQAVDQGSALPTTKAGLLHQALRSLLERGDARHARHSCRPQRDEAKIAVLAEVAWHFQQERPRPMPEDELLRVLEAHGGQIAEQPPANAAALLQELVADGVLVRRSHGPYTFLLRRFQEYCLARHVAEMAKQVSAEAFQGRILGRAKAWGRAGEWADFRPLNQPGWVEVWPLAAGCMEGNDSLVKALVSEFNQREDLVFSRLRLLTTVLAEFLEANRDRAVMRQRWEPLAEQVTDAILELIQTEMAVTGLLQSWRSCLAQLPAALVVPKVVAGLETERREPRRGAAYALTLGEIGSQEAREHLQLLLNGNHDEELRAQAAVALGLVGDAPAREALLTWLQRSAQHEELQFGCIRGLALVADTPARAALAMLLKETENERARWQCLQECERLFGPEIERSLLGLFKSLVEIHPQEDVETQIECAGVLGRIGSPAVAQQLLELLSQPLETLVKRALCDAIAEIGDEQGRDQLRTLVLKNDVDRELSFLASLALIRVGDEKLLPHLLKVVANPKTPAGWRKLAVQACQECGSELVPEFLARRLLEDPALDVKEAASKGLARFNGPLVRGAWCRARQLPLPPALDFQCLCGWASQGENEAVQELIASLQDRQQKQALRLATVEVLGTLDLAEARRALQGLYEDVTEAAPIRSRCLDMLRTIQRQEGWRPLEHGNWEAP